MGKNELVDDFVEIVGIPSPSGRELSVAKHVMKKLKGAGIDCYMDNANNGTEFNSGNVVAKIEGKGPKLVFLAHMDTVEDGERVIKPRIRNGIIRSDGKTILGADNKAGVVSLIAAVKEISQLRNRPNITCIFTICEETNMLGARRARILKGADFVFDIDGGGPPGTFTTKALGVKKFRIKFFGREAHAARIPEKGRHAIRAAALAITKLRMGKRGDGSTLNVGMINGGRRTNVIPDLAEVVGETRAYTNKLISKRLAEAEGAAKAACRATGCRYEFEVSKDTGVPPFETSSAQKILSLAKAASDSAGLKFVPFTLDACVQANVLSHRGGFPVVELCRGGGDAHSPLEWTTAKNLVDTRNLIVEIAKNASRFTR